MKKILVFIAVLCAICGSAFAAVTISDWGIASGNFYGKPIIYEGLMEDTGSTGFTVHASPEMWSNGLKNIPVTWYDGDSPWVAFQSNNVSQGLMINYDTASFEINVTGFDDIVFSEWGETAVDKRKDLDVAFLSTDSIWVTYETPWNGDGLYKFGYDQIINYKPQTSDFEVREVVCYIRNISDSFHFGDNTTGTVEFIFPETEVPEPSSLLALAFGGAGTALALRRRK